MMNDIPETHRGQYIIYLRLHYIGDRRGRDRVVVGFQLPVQSVPITTNIVSSNPAQTRCA